MLMICWSLVLNPSEIAHLKSFLHTEFTIKDLGRLQYYLGIEITYVPEGITMSQRKFSNELISDCGLTECKDVNTPLPLHIKLNPDLRTPLLDPTSYRALIGKLNFLTHTRPDLSFSVQYLNQFMQNPSSAHMEALLHVLSYVKATTGQGILLKGNAQINLHAYYDSDWATCPFTRKSVTGYIVLFGGLPISWKSKKQTTISKSSSEADTRRWLKSLLS